MKCKCDGRICNLCNGSMVFENGYVDPETNMAPLISCGCDGGRVCKHVERGPADGDLPDVIAACVCCGMSWTGDSSS